MRSAAELTGIVGPSSTGGARQDVTVVAVTSACSSCDIEQTRHSSTQASASGTHYS